MSQPNPFDLDQPSAYRAWREQKLAHRPASADDLVVTVADPRHLTDSEYAALHQRLRHYNMAIYASDTATQADKQIPRALGLQFGLAHLDSNYLADDDGITSLTVNPHGEHPHYIPYTNRPIRWHTDGYYNTPERQIRAIILHCVQSAGSGGDNGLLDHELVYIALRDEDPELIRALMDPAAMTIPPGTEGDGGERGERAGPVFSIQQDGCLHMRYTARKRNIQWHAGAPAAAAARLEALLEGELAGKLRARLEPGMGLICNNVLHDRTGFDDPGATHRLIYRARYFDRVRDT